MNAYSTMDAPGQDLVTPVQIEALCAGRDTAIDHWLAAYDGFHQHTADAASAAGVAISLPLGRGSGYDDTALSEAFMRAGIAKRWDEHKQIEEPARDRFAHLIAKAIDRRCWQNLMDKTNGEALMDRQAKEEFRNSLENPPEFTVENCRASFTFLWESRHDLFLRGVANAFSRLDRRFRSHGGFKIGARMVLEGVFETKDWSKPHLRSYERRDTFADIERIFHELDGKPVPDRYSSTFSEVEELRCDSLPQVVHGDYFRIRVFKNGNLHIWFERDDLLREVNKLLAEYYGEVIGDGFGTTEADDAPEYHVTPAKNFGEFFTSEKLASKVLDWANIGKDMKVLEPSAGGGALARAARDLGADVTCIEIQPGLAHELRVLHGFKRVYNEDFLKVSPDSVKFDAIVMNPPFDRGRDCDHVRHAWQFVKPGGTLCAIMSARAEFGDDARHRALHKIVDEADARDRYGRSPWHDLPAGSFAHAGTMVNTVCLVLRKKGA